ncbi:MAG TPA: site-2 protease family protein [Vicinamibacterales bacterium]|nr:site-2 protease family protein [Vicinamibacterales bacterium]
MADLDIPYLVIAFAVLIFSLTVHEAAHAWSASRLGDDTARRLGRVSLNPVVHVDPIGTLLLPLVAIIGNLPIIGWAKPTPVNPRNLRHPRRDNVLVTAAGPASNLMIAVVAAMALRLIPAADPSVEGMDVSSPLILLAIQLVDINLLLALFNMIPVPPLDGGRVMAGLLPPALAIRYNQFGRYGFIIIYALMLTGALGALIGPPYYFLRTMLR